MIKIERELDEHLIEHVRKNRRLYGGIFELPSKKRVYLAYRDKKEIFRNGAPSISDAIRKGIACWALDVDTLGEMKAKGIAYVGVRVRESGDIYITHLKNFYDEGKVQVMNFKKRGGELQRYLPLTYFIKKEGEFSL